MLCGMKRFRLVASHVWKETQGFEFQAEGELTLHVDIKKIWMFVALTLLVEYFSR